MNRQFRFVLFFTASMIPLAAHAQSGNSSESQGGSSAAAADEIIVTAQKREQRISDVPLSITAATGEQLAKQGISSPADLEKIAPGFTFRTSQNGTPVFSIRGVGFYNEQVAAGPTVTVYTDQMPLPYARMTQGAALDIERVEVLKGPQGTLFGQNSTGGAVNYIAAKPTDDFHAGVDAGYGRFNEATLGGFISGPIGENLKVRIAARYEHRDDWQKSITRDDSAGKRNFLVGRILLDWKPTERLSIELNVNGWRDRSDLQVGQPRGYLPLSTLPPATPRNAETAANLSGYPYPQGESNRAADWDPGRDLRRNDRFFQIAGKGQYDIGDDVRLISITSFSKLRTYGPIDGDATNFFVHTIDQHGRIRSFSQEVRLEGDAGANLKWVLGASYQKDHTKDDQDPIFISGSNAQLGPIFFDSITILNIQRVRDLAAFASLEYKLTEGLSIQGSARYTDEHRSFEGCLGDTGSAEGIRIPFNLLLGGQVAPGGCATILPDGTNGLVHSQLNQDNLSWRGSLNWKFAPQSLLYASVARGYKAGSFSTLPAITSVQYTPATQESVTAYEVGLKMPLFDRALDLAGSVFYYDYSDKQIEAQTLIEPFGPLPQLLNIPQSRLVGAELSLTARPLDGLRINAGATYVDSKVKGSYLTYNLFGDQVDVEGEAFPATPKWQLQGDAEYEFSAGDRLMGFVGASVNYRSGTTASFGSKLGPAGTQDFFSIKGYATLDLRVGTEIDGFGRVELYGRNVTGTKYWTNVTHIYDTYVRFTGMPATYGVRVSTRF